MSNWKKLPAFDGHIHQGDLAMEYHYKFTEKKELDQNTIQMAMVEVFTPSGKRIGSYSFSDYELREVDGITKAVKMLVREYELHRFFEAVF